MNKLEKIYQQCVGHNRYEKNWGRWVGELNYEKFAQLIIQECIEAVKTTSVTHANTTYDLSIIKATIAKSIESIEKHFE
jgi:hypothetical protein